MIRSRFECLLSTTFLRGARFTLNKRFVDDDADEYNGPPRTSSRPKQKRSYG